MPRAKRRIPMRESIAASMSAPVEWELAHWQGLDIGGLAFTSLAEWELAWEAYRELLLPAFIKAMPGARPFGAYVCGEIALPPIVESPRQHDRGRRIGSVVFHDAHCYGIADIDELEHLIGLGLVGAAEERSARKRIDEHGSRSLYRFVSNDTRGETACHE
jgi:hypothetical protein